MEFPDDVLRIIKAYSMPFTRADWRTCCKFSQRQLKQGFKHVVMQRHYKIITCRNEEYMHIYYNYKPLFQIRKYDAMFHSP